MNKNIYLIGGCKGGVGKSIVSMAVLDYLQEFGSQVLFVETDTSNPDVGSAYEDSVTTHYYDLDESKGWADLMTLCDNNKDNIVVINSAARNNKGVSEYIDSLCESLPELKRQFVTLWVINRQASSIELLEDYLDSLSGTDSIVHVIRNEYWGTGGKFEIFNNSPVQKEVINRGGKIIDFPDLPDLITDEMSKKKQTIKKASEEQPFGNRALVKDWRKKVRKVFKEIING